MTSFVVGNFIGALGAHQICDRYGRRCIAYARTNRACRALHVACGLDVPACYYQHPTLDLSISRISIGALSSLQLHFRAALASGSFVFLGGAVMQAVTSSLHVLYAGRVVAGLAIGVLCATVSRTVTQNCQVCTEQSAHCKAPCIQSVIYLMC